MARNGSKTKRGKSQGATRPSSTGKVRNVNADQTNWRRQLQESRIKFDDDQKEIYLRELAEHGLKGQAAQAAGVCGQTVLDHVENDEDFANARDAAMQAYRDTVAAHVRRRGQDGWLEPVFSSGQRVMEALTDERGLYIMRHKETGKLMSAEDYQDFTKEQMRELEPVMVPASVRKFSDRLLELEAKRVEPAYRDKQTIDLNQTGGGVLVAPAGMTVEEAVAEGERANEEARKRREKELAERGQKQERKGKPNTSR